MTSVIRSREPHRDLVTTEPHPWGGWGSPLGQHGFAGRLEVNIHGLIPQWISLSTTSMLCT